MSVELAKEAINNAKLSIPDCTSLIDLLKTKRDEIRIQKLDHDIFIGKSRFGKSIAIPVEISSYSKDRYDMLLGAYFNIDEDEFKLPELLKKLGLSVRVALPSGCESANNYDIEEYGGWEFGDWDDPARCEGMVHSFKLVTKHKCLTKQFCSTEYSVPQNCSTGIYYSTDIEELQLIICDDVCKVYSQNYSEDTVNRVTIGEIEFDLDNFKEVKADDLDNDIWLMDYTPNRAKSATK